MERRGRLADRLAVPAGELLPHGLDHFPLARLRLQRSRHILAELAQAGAAAARARRRRIDHHALARKVIGERVALGALAREGGDRRRFGDRVERRGRLADPLAIPAGELLPHRLDHLPLARLRLQRPRHVLAELAQAFAPAAFASGRRIEHDALARKVIGERGALVTLSREPGDVCRLGERRLRRDLVLARARLQLLERKRQLVDQPRRAFRALPVDLTLQLGDPQLLQGDQRRVFRRLGAGDRQLGRDLQAPGLSRRQRRL